MTLFRTTGFAAVVRFAVPILFMAGAVRAGPPFATDDPEPVELHHGELYLATQQFRSPDGWSGAAPLCEVNYGVVPDVQLHFIAPFEYDRPSDAPMHAGYGDTELGFKYRFLHETDVVPQAGIFPIIEIPTGNREEGLGNGQAQVFLPLWFQKKFGDWLTYGGGGYWINPGDGNRDNGFAGWEVQRKITESFAAGIEVQYRTADTVGGRSSSALNAGGIWDLSDTYHVLFSAGHTVQGPSEFQGYLGFLVTLGTGESGPSGK